MNDAPRSCATVRAHLSAHLDGALDPARARAVRLHLVQCESCAHEERLLLALGRAAGVLPTEIPDEDLAARVRRLAAPRRWVPTATRVAAAIIIVGVVGVVAHRIGVHQGQADRWSATPSGSGTRGAGVGLQPDDDPNGSRASGPGVPTPSDPTDEPKSRPTDLADGTGTPAERLRPAHPDEAMTPFRPDPDEGDTALAHATPVPLPTDREAVRASRTVFADLDLVDVVPPDVHRTMLASQIAYFDLDRWARADVEDRPTAVREVATLVVELVDLLELAEGASGGAEGVGSEDTGSGDAGSESHPSTPRPDAARLARLRSTSGEATLWDRAQLAVGREASSGASRGARSWRGPTDVGRLVSKVDPELAPDTRRSLLEWVAFKADFVRGEDAPAALVGLIGSLPTVIEARGPATASVFELPDLEALLGQIEWTTDADGRRRGELHVEETTGNGFRAISIRIERF